MIGDLGLPGRGSQRHSTHLGHAGAVSIASRKRVNGKASRRSNGIVDPHSQVGDRTIPYIPEIELLPAAVYLCNAYGIIVDYNRSAADLWGRSPIKGDTKERLCGFARRFRMDGSELPLEHSPTAHALASGKRSRDIEVTVERSDGSRRSLLFNVGPIRGARNDIVGAVIVAQDINGWKLTTETLHHTAMQEALQQFAADVAHRYCNLFATMSSNLERMRTKADRSRFDECLDAVNRSVEKGLALADRLLSLTRDPSLICDLAELRSFEHLFDLDPEERKAKEDVSSDRSVSERGGTVLLVDDDPAVRSVAADALATMGFTVLGFDNGEAAAKVIRSDQPLQLAVVNAGMVPSRSSELLREIRAVRPELKVLVITGHAELPDCLAGRAKETLLLKMPFRVEELAKGVQTAMTDRGG